MATALLTEDRECGGEDLLALVSFLWQLDTRRGQRIGHLLDLVVDGLRRR